MRYRNPLLTNGAKLRNDFCNRCRQRKLAPFDPREHGHCGRSLGDGKVVKHVVSASGASLGTFCKAEGLVHHDLTATRKAYHGPVVLLAPDIRLDHMAETSEAMRMNTHVFG